MNSIGFPSKRTETQDEKEIRHRKYIEMWRTWNSFGHPIPSGTFKLPTSAPSAKASGGRIGGSNWGA